jgi:hypothetical protein
MKNQLSATGRNINMGSAKNTTTLQMARFVHKVDDATVSTRMQSIHRTHITTVNTI